MSTKDGLTNNNQHPRGTSMKSTKSTTETQICKHMRPCPKITKKSKHNSLFRMPFVVMALMFLSFHIIKKRQKRATRQIFLLLFPIEDLCQLASNPLQRRTETKTKQRKQKMPKKSCHSDRECYYQFFLSKTKKTSNFHRSSSPPQMIQSQYLIPSSLSNKEAPLRRDPRTSNDSSQGIRAPADPSSWYRALPGKKEFHFLPFHTNLSSLSLLILHPCNLVESFQPNPSPNH